MLKLLLNIYSNFLCNLELMPRIKYSSKLLQNGCQLPNGPRRKPQKMELMERFIPHCYWLIAPTTIMHSL